ncbi:Uncharacterized conserved protein, MAPEG superfamily [Sulfitobacter marinus]|uniref:Uncharacterized conserved protein, MAPEG superfamily n=1 Tax=Sulfitobacter marinus TaxID=394264 RepID=A0A1I6U837_9RHOB|nr:MAPEG family protein [Sulfitobacter marinus]SFS97561.1 Uncharacterized conserved protein, MAPEG superfamily [Sulfitobacter marinus]
MGPELTVLILAALLQVVTFAIYAIPANLELGMGYTLSARDREPTRQMSERTARLGRALNNMFEALILFGIAALVIQTTNQSTPDTAALAWVSLAARIAYIPAYAYGLCPGRSLIWAVGFGATVLMLIAALF